MIRLTVPGRPVAKGRPRFGNGRAHTPQATRDFEEFVNALCMQQRIRPLEGELAVTLRFYCPRRSPGDVDNLAKACLDGMQVRAGGWGVFANDVQVVELHAYRLRDDTNPRTEIEVELADDAPDLEAWRREAKDYRALLLAVIDWLPEAEGERVADFMYPGETTDRAAILAALDRRAS